MRDVQFAANFRTYTATIISNGLLGQHSIRKIVDCSDDQVTIAEVFLPFTVRLLSDDDFAIFPTSTMNHRNRALLLALVAALQKTES